MATFRQLLDFCEVMPHPARDKRLKLPSAVAEEPVPPTPKQFVANALRGDRAVGAANDRDGANSDDRTAERRVFIGLTDSAVRHAMARACVASKIPHFHPHDLRHRRLSLWHGQGVPLAELAKRAGHSKASKTLDVYSHEMPLDECSPEILQEALRP
jgi:integrase